MKTEKQLKNRQWELLLDLEYDAKNKSGFLIKKARQLKKEYKEINKERRKRFKK